MKRGKLITCVATAVAAICLTSFPTAHAKKPGGSPGGGGGGGEASKPYTLVDLGGLTGGDFIQAWAQDVNNPDAGGNLMVVGFSFAPNRDEHAVLWDVTAAGQNQSLSDIAPAGSQNSRATDVNDLGFVLVGGRLWIAGTGYVSLPGLGGGDGSAGLMDDLGNVFGSAPDADGVGRPAVWHVTEQGTVSGPTELDEVDGFIATDVNNNGLFAGGLEHEGAAIAWFDETGILQIQILGKLDPAGEAYAVAINDEGLVAGNAVDSSGFREAFVWTAETGMVGLGTLGGPGSVATDVNNSGQIVGWSRSDGRFSQVAFLWENGRMVDLNDVTDGGGGKNWIQIASGINDAGHIVGLLHKTKPTSEDHGLLLVPNSN